MDGLPLLGPSTVRAAHRVPDVREDEVMSPYTLLWMFLVVAIPVSFVVALAQVWKYRERRDGKR